MAESSSQPPKKKGKMDSPAKGKESEDAGQRVLERSKGDMERLYELMTRGMVHEKTYNDVQRENEQLRRAIQKIQQDEGLKDSRQGRETRKFMITQLERFEQLRRRYVSDLKTTTESFTTATMRESSSQDVEVAGHTGLSVPALKRDQFEVDSGHASTIVTSDDQSVMSETLQEWEESPAKLLVSERLDDLGVMDTCDKEIQTDIREVLFQNKSQQTDDSQLDISQEKQESSQNIRSLIQSHDQSQQADDFSRETSQDEQESSQNIKIPVQSYDQSQQTDNFPRETSQEEQESSQNIKSLIQSYDQSQQTDDFPREASQEEQKSSQKIKIRVQSQDKSQQTDDSASQMTEEEQQYPYNMGQTAKTKKVIGPKGGTIELHRHKVYYPPSSLRKEKEIELSVDNNPLNFPKEGLPITSILDIKPSMKLDVPAIVTMPTTCRAASGEATIQIWSKEEGENWEKSQTVPLTNKNEITFEVDHFCGRVGTSVDGDEGNLEFTIKNRLFIQKDTGTIVSVFWQNDWSIQDIMTRGIQLDYKEVHITDQVFAAKLDEEFEVATLCLSPSNIQYSSTTNDNQTIFKLSSMFIRSRSPQSIEFFPSVDDIPDSVKRLKIEYSIATQTPKIHIIKWPIEIKDLGSSSSSPSVQVNLKKEIAGNKVASGGILQALYERSPTQILDLSRNPNVQMNRIDESARDDAGPFNLYFLLLCLVISISTAFIFRFFFRWLNTNT